MIDQATDLTIVLENRPGTLADLGEALGKQGINVEGICGFPCQGSGMLHLLVVDARAGRAAVQEAGLELLAEREVLVVDIEDRPGEMGRLLRRVANAGANVDLAYLATRTRLVIGADDVDGTRRALEP